MALEFSTIGMKLGYVTETTAGSRPTSGVTNIPDIKSIPALDFEPSNLQVTNLVDKVHRFVPGVSGIGNDFAITANLTASLKTAWASMVSAANTAFASGKSTWFEISIPNFDSFWFSGMPVDMGFNGAEVDSVAEATVRIIPNTVVGWAAAATT